VRFALSSCVCGRATTLPARIHRVIGGPVAGHHDLSRLHADDVVERRIWRGGSRTVDDGG
jgi:hypothetical protein